MAENQQPTPPSNRIIVESYAAEAVSQMAEAQKTGLEEFGKQLNTIAKSMEALTERIPQAIAQAMKNTAQAASGQGGASATASRATVEPQDFRPKPIASAWDWKTGAAAGNPSMTESQWHQTGGPSQFASRATAEAAGFDNPDDYRKYMQARSKAASEQFASGGPSSIENAVYGRLGISPTASVASSEGGAGAGEAGRMMKRFKGQDYTTQDYGNLAQDILRKGSTFQKARGNLQLGDDATAMADAAGVFSNKFLAPMDMAAGVMGPFMQRRKDRTDIGTMFGGNPQTGDIEGPLGFGVRTHSILTNDATRMGAAIQARALLDSRAAGMNKDQAGRIIAGVGSMGYKPEGVGEALGMGGGRFNQLVGAQESMFRRDPNLVNPMEEKMLDRATRFETPDYISKFTSSMKQLADVSNKTSLSIGQMQSAADAFGKFNQSRGGTYEQGVQSSVEMQAMTGIPGQTLQRAISQPYTSANLITRTGAAPWQMGNLGAGTQMMGVYDSLDQAKRMAKGQAAPSWTDPETGVKHTMSQEDMIISNMKMFNPNLTPDEIKGMLKNEKQFKATAAGKAAFENGGYTAKGGQKNWDAINKQMQEAGWSKEERAKVHDAGDMGSAAGRAKQEEMYTKVAAEHQAKVAKEEGKDGKDGKGKGGKSAQSGGVTITLSDQAAKIFNINNDSAKAAANGGGSPIVQAAMLTNPVGGMLGNVINDLNPF